MHITKNLYMKKKIKIYINCLVSIHIETKVKYNNSIQEYYE